MTDPMNWREMDRATDAAKNDARLRTEHAEMEDLLEEIRQAANGAGRFKRDEDEDALDAIYDGITNFFRTMKANREE